ncbi:unnamed protein product [Closterium sp. NIES-54]
MIHAAAPHFLWPFAVQYAAHQLNLQPRVSVPETSPTLRWTGKVGDASVFRVWGSRAFVRDLSADKLSPRAVPCVFLGFPPDAPGWQFYHPTSRHVLSSQDVTFDESVPYYRLFPYRTAPLSPPPLFLVPGPPPPVEVAGDSGAGSGGAELGGAESGGAEPGGAESGGAELGSAEPGGEEPGGAGRAAGAGVTPGAAGTGGAAAAAGVGPAGASGAAGAGAASGVGARVCPAGGTAEAAGGTGAAGPAGVGAAGASGAPGAGAAEGVSVGGSPNASSSAGAGIGAVGAGGAAGTTTAAWGTGAVPAGSGDPARPYFVPLLEQPVSPLPAPSPYTGPTRGLAERREPASRPTSPVRAARTSGRAPRQRPPAVPRTHQMELRPSTESQRVPLPSPPASSLPVLADPESDSLRASSPTVARLLSTVVTDPSFESAAASALVAELVDFAACCRLDYAAGLVAESASVCPPSVGGPVAPPSSCRLLSHQTLLWHHRLGHPSLPRLRGMHSRLLVSGLPRSLPPLPPSPTSPCLPCVEGQQRATPHSSFPPKTAPLQTLHMDVWGPARVSGQDLRPRSACSSARTFQSSVLREFCRGEGILQSSTLPASPQQNGIVERRIGLVMEVARTSMIHAAAPHFLWSFATSPTLRWTGQVGDASVFQVWGSHAFVHDTSVDKLSAYDILCVFLGFPPDAPGWQFYHPTSHYVLPSKDVTCDESVPFYHLFPYLSAPLPPPPLFLALGPPPVDPLPPQGPAPLGVSQVDSFEPVEVAVDSGTAGGGATRGAASGGAEPAGAGPGGTQPACPEPGVAESEREEPWGAELGDAEPEGAKPGGFPGAMLWREPLSPPQLREWFAQRTRLRSGATGAGGAAGVGVGGIGAGAAGGTGATYLEGARTGGNGAAGAAGAAGVGAGGTGAGAAGLGCARTGGTIAAGAGGAAGVGDGDPGAGDTGARGAGPGGASAVGAGSGDTARSRPYFVPMLHQTEGLTKCREPVSHPASPVRVPRTGRHVSRPRPLPVPGSHHMALRPSSVPQRVPLPSPPASSLADGPDLESDLACAASPTVPRLLATVVTDPSFESAAASALVVKLVDFTAAYRLDYAASLVAEFESDCPSSLGGECALGTDIF